MERATLNNLKRGVLFFLPDTCNPSCETYGPLLCRGVSVKTERYNTTWNDMWSHYPDRYINRDMMNIKFTNADGKNGELRYWKDEFEGNFSPESKPHICDTKEEAYHEIHRRVLMRKYEQLRGNIRCQYDDIVSLTERLGNTEYEDILKDLTHLRKKLTTILKKAV